MPELSPSGFFVLRTPLLPFDELLNWSEGLQALKATDACGLECLSQALMADRSLLRERLRAAIDRPEVREAIFLASPDLDSALPGWLGDPESENGQRAERALSRYFCRMAGRATPFGMCAGTSNGTIGPETRLRIAGRDGYQRRTRLDMDYLFALTGALAADPRFRRSLPLRANSSLYHAAGRVRYVEARVDEKKNRTYHLVAADSNEYLGATLARALKGARFGDLANGLADEEITLEDAEAYLDELIDAQILIPEIPLPVTGPEPIHPLLAELSEHCETDGIACRLNCIRHALCSLDKAGLGADPSSYRELAAEIESLPAKAEISRLFQVDMIKPAPESSLGSAIVEEIGRAVSLLHRISPFRQEELDRFRDAFQERYEGREVPLLEALDEEIGIGLGGSGGDGAEPSPLLAGLAFPAEPESNLPWGKRERRLLRLLSEALSNGAHEIVLEEKDIEELSVKDPARLPDSFAAMAVLAASSEAAVDRGDYLLAIDGIVGPSGTRLLGRFCHGDDLLRHHVEEHLRAEESHHPEAIYAEIAHLPEGRLGNILLRPLLREYEIPFLGQSGAPAERQIPVTDLLLSLRKGRFLLRSATLGREVIPRLTTAHNYTWQSLSVYRFLCMLQQQGCAGELGWTWGPLESAPFLPRVRAGRLALSRARWRIPGEDLRGLGEGNATQQFLATRRLRARRGIPRWAALADGDNTLPVDFENALSVDTFVQLMKKRDEAILVELLPGPDQLCATGPEGRFVHELIVPFVRQPDRPARRLIHPYIHLPKRAFSPGSEWLYVKLYSGTAAADRLLLETIAPIVAELAAAGVVDRWFLIRYADPEPHLRLRFHGDPDLLHAQALPTIQSAAGPLLESGRIRRLQIDTYEREVERYGGPEAIELAEQIFHADSEAALDLLASLSPGDAGADERWRLGLCGVDALLDDFGFDLEAKRALVRANRDGFAKEVSADKSLERQIGDKYRAERRMLDPLLQGPSVPALRVRSDRIAPLIGEMKSLSDSGRLCASLPDIAASLIHMHVNRLFRAAHRPQELVIYDMLYRLYESQIARARTR